MIAITNQPRQTSRQNENGGKIAGGWRPRSLVTDPDMARPILWPVPDRFVPKRIRSRFRTHVVTVRDSLVSPLHRITTARRPFIDQ